MMLSSVIDRSLVFAKARYMSNEQRQLFAKGSVDRANIVAGALVFGQFVTGQCLRIFVFILGLLIAGVLYEVAYRFSRIEQSA
jgi:hypothetical protein